MALEAEVVAALAAAGVGTYNVDIFVSSRAVIPTGNGPYMTVIATGGASPERTQNSVATPAYQRPNVQLMVHASTYPAALAMARAAYLALSGVRNAVLSGVYYREITPIQEPFDAGLDEQKRACVAFNIAVIKRPS